MLSEYQVSPTPIAIFVLKNLYSIIPQIVFICAVALSKYRRGAALSGLGIFGTDWNLLDVYWILFKLVSNNLPSLWKHGSRICITLCYKIKKMFCPLSDSHHSGSRRPIMQSPMRRFFVPRQRFFGHLKFQLLAIWSLFFNLWWFQGKLLKSTQFVDPIKESTWDFFQTFLSICVPPRQKTPNGPKIDFNFFF